MTIWRQRGNLWCITPAQPIGVIEVIGGSYLAATPQLTYRFFLEELASAGFIIRAWSYIPNFDHQKQAIYAWRCFRHERLRSGLDCDLNNQLVIRLGHSLGCKLHLLAPDGGGNAHSLIALSFNNFSVSESIPLLGNLSSKLQLITEFSPCPFETFHLISQKYTAPRNLLVQFRNDQLDQSSELLKVLQSRPNDLSELLVQTGNHLTPTNLDSVTTLLNISSIKTKQFTQLVKNLIDWWENTHYL